MKSFHALGIFIPIGFWVGFATLFFTSGDVETITSSINSTDCRVWDDVLLSSATGSATYDSCNLSNASISETGALGSLSSDNYLLVYSDMCGDGEIVTQITTAPSNNGFAGLEVRESTADNTAKFGITTRLSAQVQSYHRAVSGQAAIVGNHNQSFHQWLKITRSGNTFTAYTSFDAVNWSFVKMVTLSVPNCIKAGVYAQSLDNVTSTTANFNSVSITDEGLAATTVDFANSTLTASPGNTVQVCVDITNPCICTPTSVDVVLTSSSSPHLDTYTTETLTFDSSSGQDCFDLVVGSSNSNASYSFELQNISGGNNAQVGTNSQLNLSVDATGGISCGAISPPPVDTTSPVIAYDRFGNTYTINQISFVPPGGAGLAPTPTRAYDDCGCDDSNIGINTGYFDIWFEDCRFDTDEGFDDPTLGIDRRRVVCQVFAELANLIQVGNGGCGGEQTVNVQIVPSSDDTPITISLLDNNLGGVGSAYYFEREYGLAHGLPWTIINSGEVPVEFEGNMFHGTIRINFDSPTIDWHLGLPPNNPPAGEDDLYSVAMHEALHMLGFASAFFDEPFVTRFDSYLDLIHLDGTREDVVENINPPSLDWGQAILDDNDLFSSCLDMDMNNPIQGPDMVFQSVTNADYPIFTDDAYDEASSHSHLHIGCDGANTADFLMNDFLPSGIRRTITDEELDILCTLGYSIDDGTTSCGCMVAGAEDFGPDCNSIFEMSLCDNPLEITVAQLLANDNNVAGIEHVEMLKPIMGEVVFDEVNGIITFTPNRMGLAVFVYIPIGCGGQQGNATKVFINVIGDPDNCPQTFDCEAALNCADFTLPNCRDNPNCNYENDNCNLICNSTICGLSYGTLTNPFGGIINYSDFESRRSAVVPSWYRTDGTPDLWASLPPNTYLKLDGRNNYPTNNTQNSGSDTNFEGMMTWVDIALNTNYLLGFDYFSFNQSNDANLSVNLIDGREMRYSPQLSEPVNYTGDIENIVNVTSNSGTFTKSGLGCFNTSNPNLNALWLRAENNTEGTLQEYHIDNVEIIEDNFTAGPDVDVANCGDEIGLGTPFCMVTGIEVTYTWTEVGQAGVLAQYEVLNGDVNVIIGNIDEATNQFIFNVDHDATYRLSRTISNAADIGLPADYAFCTDFDDVVVNLIPEPLPATFNVVSIDPLACTVVFNSTEDGGTHNWDFGDSNGATVPDPTHTYSASGIYTVIHTVTDECGTSIEELEVIVDCCYEPELNIQVNQDGCGNITFSYTATGEDNNITNQTWTIDGVTYTDFAPIVSFTTAGDYTYSLSATNDCGATTTTGPVQVTVSIAPLPIPTLSSTTDGCYTATFILGNLQAGETYTIDYGGAGTVDAANDLIFTYTNAGTYTATVTVTNACLESTTVTTDVTVPQTPIPNPTLSSTTDGCYTATFILGNIQAGETYTIDYGGAGTVDAANDLIFTYTNAGTYTATVTVTNACLESTTVTTDVTVPQTPIPNPTLSSTTDGCYTATFILGNIQAGETYTIDYGGAGTVDAANDLIFTYTNAGTYTATVTVTNACLEPTTVTTDVIVPQTPIPNPTLSSTTDGCYTATFILGNIQAGETYTIDYGGAGTVDAANDLIFTYTNAGTYTATVTVINACGDETAITTPVTIDPPDLPVLTPDMVTIEHYGCGEVVFFFSEDAPSGTLNFGSTDCSPFERDESNPDHERAYCTYSQLLDYTAIFMVDNGCEMTSIDIPVPLAQYAPVADINITEQFCLNAAFESVHTADNFTYEWEFFDGATSLGTTTGATTNFTFPAMGTYSVELTVNDNCDPVNTSTITESVTVDDCGSVTLDCDCPTGYEITAATGEEVKLSTLIEVGFLPEEILLNTCLAVASGVTFTVDQDYIISNVDVYMNPGSEILVTGSIEGESGPTLAITNMIFGDGIQGCNQMWKGITVENATLTIAQGRIADAQYAIWAKNKATVGATRTVFERNYVSLYADNSPGHEFDLQDFWGNQVLKGSGLLAAFSGQSPAPEQTPFAAVEIKDGVAPKVIGTLAGDNTSFYRNEFMDLANGIVTENTSLVVHNTAFSNIEEDNSQSYPFTGYGIHHEGGAADPLYQRGMGDAMGDDLSFDNITQAIWVDGTRVDVAQNHMDNTDEGIHVQMAQNREVMITDNLMDVTANGVDLYHNAPLALLDVQRNDITTRAYGIKIEEMGIAHDDASIRFNTITEDHKGTAIEIRGAGNLDVSNNILDMNAAIQPAHGMKIISISNSDIKENTVDGPGGISGVTGLYAFDCSNTAFDCNTFKELGIGAAFKGTFGSPIEGDPQISTNTFAPATAGMGMGLVYHKNIMIDIQDDAGNVWERNPTLPNNGYVDAGAVNYVPEDMFSILPFQAYRVQNNTSTIYPPKVDFPELPIALHTAAEGDWFNIENNGEETAECTPIGEPNPVIPPKDIHHFIARALLNLGNYGDAMLWLAQLDLYRTIDHNPGWADPVLDSFYLAQSHSLLRDYYLIENGKIELHKTSETELATLQTWEGTLDQLITEILYLDSLIVDGDSTLIEDRDSLLNEAGTLCVSIDSLETVILQSRITATQQLLIDNTALGGLKTYQTYEKAVNDIYLSTIAQGTASLDANQINILLDLATKCPLGDGRAVHYARSLYQLVADSVFVDDCPAILPLQQPNEAVLSEQSRIVTDMDEIKIYPNPTSSEIMIEGNCDKLILQDHSGRQVFVKQLTNGMPRQSAELINLSNGIYFARLYLAGEQILVQKLVIIH